MSDALVHRLAELLRDRGAMDSDALLRAAREFWPGVSRQRLAQLVRSAESLGAVRTRHGVVEACPTADIADAEERDQRRPGMLRAVVLDVEAAVRVSAQHPGGERRIYQVSTVSQFPTLRVHLIPQVVVVEAVGPRG